MDPEPHRRRGDIPSRSDPWDGIHARLSGIEIRLSRLEGGIVLAGFAIGIGVAIAGFLLR